MGPITVIGFVGVAVAKVFAGVWFSSRATSPLSEDWRKEFLEHSQTGIDKLEKLELAPAEYITALRSDMALLRKHVSDGWNNKDVFDAACRVAAYLGWKHTTTGVSGMTGLAGTYADHHVMKPIEGALDELNRAAEKLFEALGFKKDDTEPPQNAPKH